LFDIHDTERRTCFVFTPALLLRFQEFPGSNLGPETGYPEVFVVFLSSSTQMPL
jgi:hypothetical protein